MKIKEVVLTKNDPDSRDYKEYTFKDFILIQNRAQEVADKIGYPVYLVGSAQYKHLPRDIDLAIIIPSDEYLERYNLHEDADTVVLLPGNVMTIAWYADFENIKGLEQLNFEGYKIDLKICPDNWFVEKPKLLLAKPRSDNK